MRLSHILTRYQVLRKPVWRYRKVARHRRSAMDDKTKPNTTAFRFIGKPLPRKEDERLITGRGKPKG